MTTNAAQPPPTPAPAQSPAHAAADATPALADVAVVIPTFNEEINLPHSLRSVIGRARQVFVVDSESTDRTRDIAADLGATVVVQPWLGYAEQKNWALKNLPIETNWVFILDADESITPRLWEEIEAITNRAPETVHEAGYYINRLTYFMAKPIRHCGYFPSYNLRLFKRGRALYEDREVHEHMVVDGPTANLKGLMHHEDRRGLEHFVAKHNRYSTLEARELIKHRHAPAHNAAELEKGVALRRWLKHTVLPRLPLAGLWRFFYMYVLRLGFLDGRNGLRFCIVLSIYDTLISLKLAELRQAGAAQDSTLLDEAPARGLAVAEGAWQSPVPAAEAAPSARNGPLQTQSETPPTPRRASSPDLSNADSRRTFTPADVAASPRPPVSVVILTYNEETNIRSCIESCAWSDDVHVLDSGSTDRTAEIARELGVHVHTNPFTSFGQQRTWAIRNIPCKHPWHFHLDADERFTPALVSEMARRITDNAPAGAACYRCPSMMMFMDRWLRHASEYPVYQVRLFDSRRCRFEDYGHGQREVADGPIAVLDAPYLHYSFSKGLEEWFDKHNRYSTLEATQALAEQPARLAKSLSDLFTRDTVRRRRAMKSISYRLPAKSFIVMAYMMILRRGFLDGRAGLNYARMRAIYEGMTAVKMSVLSRSKRRALDPQGGPRA